MVSGLYEGDLSRICHKHLQPLCGALGLKTKELSKSAIEEKLHSIFSNLDRLEQYKLSLRRGIGGE